MYVKGGGDPNDPGMSLSTIKRVVEEIREEALNAAKNPDIPNYAILHFDEVKITLGGSARVKKGGTLGRHDHRFRAGVEARDL